MSNLAPSELRPLAHIGILCWEAGKVPRGLVQLEALRGNSTNPLTYPFPVAFRRVEGACWETILEHPDPEVHRRMVEAGRELVASGIRGVTTSCGFNILLQQRLAEALGVPVFTSSLLQVPWVARLLGPRARIGVLTAKEDALTEEHLRCAGIDPASTHIRGLDACPQWSRIFRFPEEPVDLEAIRKEVVDTALDTLKTAPDIGAFVLECTDLPPFAEAIRRATGRPVFDFVTLVGWVHSALGTQTPDPVGGTRTFGHGRHGS